MLTWPEDIDFTGFERTKIEYVKAFMSEESANVAYTIVDTEPSLQSTKTSRTEGLSTVEKKASDDEINRIMF